MLVDEVLLVSPETESIFCDYLLAQYKNEYCGRPDWFDPSLKWSLINRYKECYGWSIALSNKKIIAFGGMQVHLFSEKTIRLCTRLYYDPCIRNQYKRHNRSQLITPVTPILNHQVMLIKDKGFSRAILTLEHFRGKKTVSDMARILNKKSQGLVSFMPKGERIQTYRSQPISEYQYYLEHRF